MGFSPEYVRLVLRENFRDAQALLLDPLIAIHYAHLVMLAGQGIVSAADARAIREALDGLDLEAVRAAGFDDTSEDLFYFVDRLIVAACGVETGGRLHTARSRNDIDMTLYRMRLREWLLDLGDATVALRTRLLDLARAHRATVFPAHTHTQPAQPTSLAHYLLAVIEQLERDTGRVRAAYDTVNRSPLGACAITGTGFPIDRGRTARLLGFDAPTGNTYGSIAAVDYLLESAAAASVLLVGLGRVLQDLLLWSTAEVGYLRLADGFVQTSSIMPQKRNPVALEHARSLASKALGQMTALPQALHNTPFGDIVDTEDDLQPLVASAFGDATRAVTLVAAALEGVTFDVDLMRARAAANGVTFTELADVLAREHGLAFRTAHAIVADVARSGAVGPADVRARVTEAARALGHDVQLPETRVADILSPTHFIDVRRTPGGPAPDVTGAAVDTSVRVREADREHLRRRRAALVDSSRLLREQSQRL